uniref:Pentraxin 4, long n=1 Tax=Sander lucioperca TaxID=283035 RepID=A0A8D0CYJ6_SANLU
MEARLALMERNLRENRRHAQKQKPDPGHDFSNLTLELQSQEERLAALQAQRDELLIGLKGLQESLKNQALRVTRLEGRLGEVLQQNGGGKTRRLWRVGDPLDSDITPQEYYEPRGRSQAHRRGRPERILDTQPRSEGIGYSQTDNHSQSTAQNRNHPQPNQYQATPNQPKHSKTQKPRPKPESYPQTQVQYPKPQPTDYLPQSDPYHPQSQIQVQAQTKPYPIQQEQLKHLCNVDSMLFFPSASAENYVTFSQTLPDLPELSVCFWLRVEASHVGTLLSYATDDNDNQLVLYGPSYASSSSSSLDFVIGDPVYRRLPASPLLDARWHHVCVLWSSIQGHFWHYSDHRLTSSGSNFRKGWEIPGGGSVVLGQEQDTVGGGFDPAEGFAGQVAGFRVWSRVLSPSEVEGVAEGRGVPRGVVLGMEDIKEVHGEVQQVACECLEYCV